VPDARRRAVTNVDPTYPVAGGLMPGAGAVAAGFCGRAQPGREPEPATVALSGSASVLRGGGRRSSVDRWRSRRRWVGRSLGVVGRCRQHGEEPVPDPPPPFVAADLGALAPTLIAAYAHA
jgi:hypothetical protein